MRMIVTIFMFVAIGEALAEESAKRCHGEAVFSLAPGFTRGGEEVAANVLVELGGSGTCRLLGSAQDPRLLASFAVLWGFDPAVSTYGPAVSGGFATPFIPRLHLWIGARITGYLDASSQQFEGGGLRLAPLVEWKNEAHHFSLVFLPQIRWLHREDGRDNDGLLFMVEVTTPVP